MPRINLIALRAGTAVEWATVDPILDPFEPGWDLTNGILKIGDGATAWSGLPSANGAGAAAPVGAGYVVTALDGTLTNETLIGSIVLPPDVIANIPAAASVPAGALFFATDEVRIYRSTGAAWVAAYAPDTLAVQAPLMFDPAPPPGTQIITAGPGVGRMVASLATAGAISNTAVNTALATAPWQAPADFIAAGDVIHAVAFGTYLNNTGATRTVTVRIQADGVTQASGVLTISVPSALLYRWRFDAWIPVAASGLTTTSGGVAAIGLPGFSDHYATTMSSIGGAVDLTQPLDWMITAQHSIADPNLQITLVNCLLEHYQL